MNPARNPHTKELRHLRRVIGNNIRTYRLKHNMILARLSRLTKFNINRLDMFEMGKDEIELYHMLVIAAALKCSIRMLLDEYSNAKEQ